MRVRTSLILAILSLVSFGNSSPVAGQPGLPVMQYASQNPAAPPAAYAAGAGCQQDCGGNDCGCGSSDCQSGDCQCGRIGALLENIGIAPSDHNFDDFISPITNPVNFEDPRTLTEARGIFINHWVPNSAGGGQVQIYAMQVRIAVSDRLSIIANKDGYVVSQNPLIQDGWANVAAGLKYNLWKDDGQQEILSAGATYEIPSGSLRTLQGIGSGVFHMFLTGGMEIGELHYISASGICLADSSNQSDLCYWSNHLDHRIGCSNFYGLFEANWFHWIKDGNNPTFAGVEGNDFFNLGSTNVAGTNVADVALGLKYKPDCHLEVGAAFEVPVTSNRGLLADRLTVDAILRY